MRRVRMDVVIWEITQLHVLKFLCENSILYFICLVESDLKVMHICQLQGSYWTPVGSMKHGNDLHCEKAG
jgi:hypothetical protein